MLSAVVLFAGAAGAASADDYGISLAPTTATTEVADLEIAKNTVGNEAENANDPLEGLNRAIFTFNEGFQDVIARPLAKTYNEAVPLTGRKALSNMFDNASAPITLANDLLQFEFERALETATRMFVNTTLGIGGMIDLAAELGMPEHREDFGQTLGAWGVGEGFYLVLPILGPSNPRDAIGRLLIDSYFDPLGTYLDNIDEDEISIALDATRGLLKYADVVEELDQIKRTSVDYYAALRSLYRQKRNAEISNGSDLDLPPIPDLSPELSRQFDPAYGDGEPVANVETVVQ